MRCQLLYGDGTLDVRLPGLPKLLLPRKTKPVAFRKPDFLLTTILDEHKRIVGVVAGDYWKAHERGCRIVDQVYGYPFQAHKTMENAVRVTRKGGVAIIVAECRDGIGPANFVTWLQSAYQKLGPNPRALVLPQGGLVFPWVATRR